MAAKASNDASQQKQPAGYSTAELRKSLQQEQERANRLEVDLAAARRDVETQTSLATKANNDASEQKQIAEQGSAETKHGTESRLTSRDLKDF